MQDKKTSGEVKICVDLRKINDACLHDPFLNPFTYEVLENVRGQEMDSQVTIRSKFPKKTTTRLPLKQNGDATNTR